MVKTNNIFYPLDTLLPDPIGPLRKARERESELEEGSGWEGAR